MACVAKYHRPPHMLDENPRKRRKITSSWDVLPSQLQVHPTLLYTGKFFGIGSRDEGENAPLIGGAEPSTSGSDNSRSTSSNIKPKEEGSRTGSPPWRSDDKDGHYMFELGENLTPRYKILSKMGEGTFGQVLECWDRKSKDLVAIKIVRGLQKYREAAMIEVDVLRKVGKYDRNGTRCVQMREWFDYRNHTCIVFEKLGPSLYDFLRKNNYSPFPIDLVREVGRQLLESVAYMHELKLVHTDLKPENTLFVSSDSVKVPDCKGVKGSPDDFKRLPKSSAIKLIDFGSTTFEDQDHTSVVSTRHYRAPEVVLGELGRIFLWFNCQIEGINVNSILSNTCSFPFYLQLMFLAGLGWNYPCDIWSVGCILVELCSGETLFQTHENLEHLAMMERVLGPLPHHMIKKSDRRYVKYFRHGTRLNWPEGASSRESIRAVRKLPKLRDLIMQHVDHSAGLFIDLLQGLLKFEPSERLKASEALRHPFFREHSRRSDYSAYNP